MLLTNQMMGFMTPMTTMRALPVGVKKGSKPTIMHREEVMTISDELKMEADTI